MRRRRARTPQPNDGVAGWTLRPIDLLRAGQPAVADIADEDSRVAMSVGRDGSEGEHGVVFIVDERGDGVGCCG
jgi:hypothetical protein